jgi:hypothetical protein
MKKISYILPGRAYHAFQEIIEPLKAEGYPVEVNQISDDTDIILPAMLLHSPRFILPIRESMAKGKKLILWWWDDYSFTDRQRFPCDALDKIVHEAHEVWCPSYETSRELKQNHDADSYYMPCWLDLGNLKPKRVARDFVFFAAAGCALGKRLPWAERACQLLNLPLEVSRNQLLPRGEYFQQICECKVYLSPGFEESHGAWPAKEAAAADKPLVVADIATCREAFGNCEKAFYFRNESFLDLKRALMAAWNYTGQDTALAERMARGFGMEAVIRRMVSRLAELESKWF